MSLFKKRPKQKYLKVIQNFTALKENREMHIGELILVSDDISLVVNKDRENDFKKKKINDKSIVEEIEL